MKKLLQVIELCTICCASNLKNKILAKVTRFTSDASVWHSASFSGSMLSSLGEGGKLLPPLSVPCAYSHNACASGRSSNAERGQSPCRSPPVLVMTKPLLPCPYVYQAWSPIQAWKPCDAFACIQRPPLSVHDCRETSILWQACPCTTNT